LCATIAKARILDFALAAYSVRRPAIKGILKAEVRARRFERDNLWPAVRPVADVRSHKIRNCNV
jgi:hypothetical protein